MRAAKFGAILGYCASLLLATAAVVAGTASGYHVVHGWPLLPEGRILGNVAGVAVNSRNEVFVFDRGKRPWKEPLPTDPIAEPTIKVFDGKTGKLLREFGEAMFAMPHGISIDSNDHIWVTDVSLNQVFELDASGKVLHVLGQKGVAGSDNAHFDKPTDVAFLSDGSVLVSDGYGNSRIVEFASNGSFKTSWGSAGKGPGQFNLPHAVAVDAADRVYVADRENDRVQVFDRTGAYIAQWSGAIGRPFGLAAMPQGRIAVLDGGEQPKSGPDRASLAVVDGNGQVRERIGRFGNYDGQFWAAHDVAYGRDGSLYVVDIAGQRVQKFVRP